MAVQQTSENFIGRDQEIEFFQHWLEDEHAVPILYVCDALKDKDKKGGIGKTWLLHRLFEIVQTRYSNVIPVMVDFFNVIDRDGVVIAERLVQAVQQRYPHWSPVTFREVLDHYHEKGSATKTEANLRDRLADALISDLKLLQVQWETDNVIVLLFFDTFEVIEHNCVTAALRPSQTFPDFYQSTRIKAIIAGRNELSWSHPNWVGREQEVAVHLLPPFNPEEMVQYLETRSYVYTIDELEPDIVQALYNRCEGRPILIGLVTDVLNERIRTPEALITTKHLSFEASLVEEINQFGNPSRWAIFSMAHIYHRFDRTLLKMLMDRPNLKKLVPEIHYQELAERLPQLSFVRRSISGEDFVLHDEMRRLVNKHCWEKQDPDERIRRELSALAIEYYTTLIAREELVEMRQSYVVEMLFHKLFIDVASGFQYFMHHFGEAIELAQVTFARSLLGELQKFEQRLTDEQRKDRLMAEARLLRSEYNAEEALKICQALELDMAWFEQHQAELLYEKSQCYIQLGQLREALPYIQTCLMIEKQSKDKTLYANLFKAQGFIYRRLGQYKEAMRSYEECLRIQRNLDDPKDYATLLNNIANILRFQNRLEEALRYCKLSLRIRRDLHKQKKISEYDVGLSYSLLGHIYHELEEVGEEERAYQEAFNIYNRVGDKHGIAGTYNCFGRVYAIRGDVNKALENFRQAARIAIGVNHETEIESLNQQGRVFARKVEWQEAKGYFERALALSRKVEQSFQIAENLLYLANVYNHLGLSSTELIKELKRIARRHDYKGLLGRAEEIQGDMFYEREEYQRAFKRYRVAGYYFAQRGSPEFDRYLRRLNDLLLDVPESFLPGVIDSLLQYWYDKGLDQTHSQLLSICREVNKHMVL